MSDFYDAFISYGRPDSKAFAVKLREQLSECGYRVWLDLNDIPLGVDYQRQIDDDINRSHNFLFIMSPHAVNSDYCRLEIEQALTQHKRIIPILHVEEISEAMWCDRNPGSTDAGWEACKTQNHQFGDVRNPNLHPVLRKINWVYMRDGQDDWTLGFNGLTSILERHRDYVQHHTQLLVQALTWKHNQRRTQLLLIGDERDQAEAWLKMRFKDGQPPCTPTDLQCEFITESIKNSNNLMTQVFIAYADDDALVMQQVRRSLWREGITVWTSASDIHTGEDFQKAIEQGIEQADNVIYLLSPASVTSGYCQHELEYAIALNKRIIPMLVRPTALADREHHLPKLKGLQYIDLTDNRHEEDDWLDESQLLRILKTDESYYQTHKVLLVNALKWERQQRNSSILLRGYNLRQAETWLKTAQKRSTHPPTDLQTEFIEHSLHYPPPDSLDVFISYSRSDSGIARQLNENLQIYGKLTWFDQESIAESSADFQQEIYRGIETADNFLFILSPKSVNSPYCADEVEYAAKHNKRFITVLHQAVNVADLHPELAKVQWIDFTRDDIDFWDAFNQVVRVLETDREYVRQHTKWLQRAIEWEQKHRTEDVLLRGTELAIAQDWLQDSIQQQKKPSITPLQKDYIKAGVDLRDRLLAEEQARQQKELKQARQVAIGSIVALVCVAGLGLLAGLKWQEARRQRIEAQVQELRALAQTAAIRSVLETTPLEPLLVSLEAGTLLKQMEASVNPEVRATVMTELAKAIDHVAEFNRFDAHEAEIYAVDVSPDDQQIATASGDSTVRVWTVEGRQTHLLEGHESKVTDVQFSPSGEHVISAGMDGTVRIWSLNENNESPVILEHPDRIDGFDMSPDGSMIVTGDYRGILRVWSADGVLLNTIAAHDGPIFDVEVSPDGHLMASASQDKTAKLWTADGTLQHQLADHTDWVLGISFNPDQQTLVTSSQDQSVILWDIAQGVAQQTITEHDGSVTDVQFSPNGQTLATASHDRTVQLWDAEGNHLQTLQGHEGILRNIRFSRDGRWLVSAGDDQTARLWQLDSPRLMHFKGHPGGIYDVDISSDDQMIASIGAGGEIYLWEADGSRVRQIPSPDPETHGYAVDFSPSGDRLVAGYTNGVAIVWTLDGTQKAMLSGHDSAIFDARFSPDGGAIATSSYDQTIKLWDLEGNVTQTLRGQSGSIQKVMFSPDGQVLASACDDQTVVLWNVESGDRLATLVGHEGNITGIDFSPDGQIIASTGSDGTVKLWGLDGTEQLSISDPKLIFEVVQFSPDGRYLMATSHDNTTKVWTPDGQPVTTLEGHTGQVWSGDFSADGRFLVTASNDGTLIRWDLEKYLNLDALLKRGCDWASAYLSSNPQAPQNLCLSNTSEGRNHES